jgi:hypothetical protein
MKNTGWEGRGVVWSEIRSSKVVAPPMLVKDWSSVLGEKFVLCTGAYKILWGPANWVASCVVETAAILPYLAGVKWDSAWATHGVFAEAYVWKTCTRVRWALIIYLIVLWIVTTRGALLARVCRVVRLISVTLARCSHSVELTTS